MAKSETEITAANTALRTRGRGGNSNFPSTAQPEEPGENSRFVRYALVSLDLPPIDISDLEQCKQRAREYFQFCIDNDRKPNIVGLCNWLGISRDTMHTWRTGEYRPNYSDFFKKCVDCMEEINLDYFMNGKVNPAAGIFILKNHFGYKDITDLTIEPKQGITDENAANIAHKYAELPED